MKVIKCEILFSSWLCLTVRNCTIRVNWQDTDGNISFTDRGDDTGVYIWCELMREIADRMREEVE